MQRMVDRACKVEKFVIESKSKKDGSPARAADAIIGYFGSTTRPRQKTCVSIAERAGLKLS